MEIVSRDWLEFEGTIVTIQGISMSGGVQPGVDSLRNRDLKIVFFLVCVLHKTTANTN